MCLDRSRTPSLVAAQRATKLPRPSRRTPSRGHWPRRCANASRLAGLCPLHFDISAIADGVIRVGLSRRRQPELLQVRQWTRQSPPQAVMFGSSDYSDIQGPVTPAKAGAYGRDDRGRENRLGSIPPPSEPDVRI